MALVNGGGYAEYTTVDEDHVMAIPDHMTFAEAAAIPEVWLTAYQLLHLIGEYVATVTQILSANVSMHT